MKLTKSKRRPLTLMEVLIALLIIALCAVPLIAPNVRIYREERNFVDKLRLDRAVSLLYGELVVSLHQNQIPWAAIEGGQQFSVDPGKLEQLLNVPIPFKGHYKFSEVKHKPEKIDLFTVYLFSVKYEFTQTNSKTTKPITYSYDVFIARDLPAQQSS